MINPTQQETKEKFDLLTEEEVDLYFSAETAEKIRRIVEEYLLETSHMTILADEVGLRILHFTDKDSFISNLTERLDITREKAQSVVESVYKRIFSSLKEPLIDDKTVPREAHKEIKEPLSTKVGDTVIQSEAKQSTGVDIERIKQLLRANNKTVNIKNIIANLK